MSTAATTSVENIINRVDSGYFQTNTGTKAEGWPTDSGTWHHLISSTHDNVDNYFSLQISGDFFDNDNFFVRKTAGDGNREWRKLWHDGNLNPRTPSVDRINFTDQAWLEGVHDPASGQTRIEFKRNNTHPNIYADILMGRDTRGINATGQGFGGVSSQIKLENRVGAADVSQWNFLSVLEITQKGAGQHCAGYLQTNRRADTAAFTACFEHRDWIPDPQVGNVAFELDIFGAGGCGSGKRVGLDIVYGGAAIYAPGDQVIGEGISISPVHGHANWYPGLSNGYETSTNTGRAIVLNAIRVAGNTVTGIDLSGMDPNFNYQGSDARGVRHPNGLLDVWDNGGHFGFRDDKMVIAMPQGGLQAGQGMPGHTVARLKVNIAGYGDAYIPIIS